MSQRRTRLQCLNKVAPFKIPKRSTYIAARIGRPEKAKERLMKPAPNVLFPISDIRRQGQEYNKRICLRIKEVQV